MYPIFDILEGKVYEYSQEENVTFHQRFLLYIGQNKFVLRVLAIVWLLPICPFLDGIAVLIMLNGYFCINFFQLVLPNYIMLAQEHENQIINHVQQNLEEREASRDTDQTP